MCLLAVLVSTIVSDICPSRMRRTFGFPHWYQTLQYEQNKVNAQLLSCIAAQLPRNGRHGRRSAPHENVDHDGIPSPPQTSLFRTPLFVLQLTRPEASKTTRNQREMRNAWIARRAFDWTFDSGVIDAVASR